MSTQAESIAVAGRPKWLMHTSLITSALGHAALVLGALVHWGSPKPLPAAPPPSVMVDLVTSREVPQALNPPPAKDGPRQEPLNDNPPKQDEGKQTPAEQTVTAHREATRARDPQTMESDKAIEPSWAERILQSPSTVAIDLGSSPSEIGAKLPHDKVTEFKAHLDRCWVPPAAITDAQKLKVVIRIALKPNGQLTAAPTLLQGPASNAGPILAKSAVRALQQCQPYSFLPADKYKEWKILDLSFTQEGLSGV